MTGTGWERRERWETGLVLHGFCQQSGVMMELLIAENMLWTRIIHTKFSDLLNEKLVR